MKRTYKMISVILSLSLLLAVLVGCGSSNSNAATDNTANTSTNTGTNDTGNVAAGADTDATVSDISWPEKPITIVVPGAAGGGTDLTCRMMQKYLSEELGVQIVVSNIKGGACSIGSTEVYNAEPDGYTALWLHEDMITMNVLGVTDFGYRDFEIVGRAYDVDTIGLIARKEITSLADLKERCDEAPGEVAFAIDTGTIAQMIPLLVEDEMNVDFKEVDAGNLAERVPLMLSGQLDVTFAPIGNVKDYIANGDLNCIGVLGEERSELAPDIPTCIEQGVDITSNKFFNLYLPKGTPVEVVEKFSAALEAVCKNEDFVADAAVNLFKVSYGTPDEARAVLEETEAMFNVYKDKILGG